jgi:hypothetical protein
MFISLIYLTNLLYLRSTDVEGYGINKDIAPTEIKQQCMRWDDNHAWSAGMDFKDKQ